MARARTDKLIVTNLEALDAKYGSKLQRIHDAVDELIAADKERGLRTRLLGLDDAAAMRRLRSPRVTAPGDPRETKTAIDAVYRKLKPDYLMILGSIDVVPQQNLDNPLYDPDDDADLFIPSDLPYACDAPYSRSCRKFRGPTRIVGRLPDLTGAGDPAYLISLLRTAAGYVRRPRRSYRDYFGVSNESWASSTALSLERTFGHADDLRLVPPRSHRWGKKDLRRRAHFINCHGMPGDPFFYGESAADSSDQPESHSASYLEGKVAQGTVVAAECCYGAELYPPALADGQAGIYATYLRQRAYGFFGSSTIAYGPSEGNGEADYICQFFLQEVLAGASTGRAVLEARQKFVQWVTILDPHNLKTLAQFNLMGDPSIHPVQPTKHRLADTETYKKVFPRNDELPAGRELRRQKLVRNGIGLAGIVSAARFDPKLRPSGKVRQVLLKAARQAKMRNVRLVSYVADDPARDVYASPRLEPVKRSEIHVALGKRRGRASVPQTVVILATVQEGEILRLRRLHSR